MVHAYYHALVYSLLFLSNSFFFFLSFLLHFSLFFLFPCGGCYVHSFFLSSCSVFLGIPIHGRGPFYTACREGVFTILPLNCFCLGVSVLPDHPLVFSATQPPPLTYAGRATSYYQTKSLILFACSPWHFHLDKGRHSLSLSLMACT